MTDAQAPRAGEWRFPAALVLLTATWLAMLLFGGGPLDRQIYEALYAGHRPVLAAIAHGFTALGEPTVLLGAGVAVGLWLCWARHIRIALVLVAVVMIGRSLTELQKYWVGRVRPGLEPHLVVVQTSSFPSGHSASSMIFYLSLALVLGMGKRWQVPAALAAIALSLCIGLSRVMLGVHWPSDVIGGWSFGLLWVLLTVRVAGRVLRR